MKTVITVPQSAIKAVSFSMAVKDIRYYLNGMLLQHNGQETRLVATDGHRLHAGIVKHKGGKLLPSIVQAIIPDALVKTMLKAKAGKYVPKEIIITIEGDNIKADLFDDTSASAKAIDGKFPDYSRVIPEKASGDAAQFNPAYLADAEAGAQAWVDMKNFNPTFNHNGDSSGFLAVDGFVAVVMPRRANGGMDAPDPEFRREMAVAAPVAVSATATATGE